MMKHTVTLLLGCFGTLLATAENISFADEHVKSICVKNWDTNGDQELSLEEAAAVTSLRTKFGFDTEAIRFPELQYFTGLTSINTYDFYSCKNLRTIVLPPQITSIGSSAFFGCLNLQEIVIPDNVKTISEYAFNGCNSLRSVTLPEGLKTISDYAFSTCYSLQALAIPASVTSIALSAFWSCSSLSSITVDPANTVYDSREGCNAIIKTSTNTLQLGITTTVIPASVTAIGQSAFYGNTKLQTIDIPEGVKTIGGSAFSGCTALATVNLPSTLTSISNSTFSGCKKLTGILLPEGLTSIGQMAFQNCSSLKKVFLPASLTSIGLNAFSGCSRLTKVAAAYTTPLAIDSTVFPYYKKSTLYVPKGCLDVYRNAETWQDFNAIVELGSSISAIVNPTEMDMSTTSTLDINLTNDDFFSYRSLQMDFILPNRFSFDADNIVLSERVAGMTVTLVPLEDNGYRLTCASESVAITETSGMLLALDLLMINGAASGNYQGLLQNIILTDEGGMQHQLDNAEFSWTVVGYPLGDVNHDGIVNVTDITLLVDYILGNTPPVFYEENADFDQNGTISVTDVTGIVDCILSNH
ncbi:MAG: leucine-rich repeat protein [Prevotella sp.]|nr:leucine-rich repeat protein [Prevotella sp.]